MGSFPDSTDELKAAAKRLRDLHVPGHPLVLPNVWDVPSAQLVEATGFPAVATSSVAIAAALGYPDDDTMPTEEVFAVLGRITKSVSVPVTADIEGGYRLDGEEIVRSLTGSGVVGCNVEDTDHHGHRDLIPLEMQSSFLKGVRSAANGAGLELVLNARVDVFRRKESVTPEMFEEALRRADAYFEAGADCIYPIGLSDEDLIARFVHEVQAPVNVMATANPASLRRLAALGVARISFGGGLMRHVHEALGERLRQLHSALPE